MALPNEFPGISNIEPHLYYLMGVRGPRQFFVTLRGMLDPERFCGFCNVGLAGNQPLHSLKRWYLKENDFPNKKLEKMLLILPKAHITKMSELTGEDGAEIIELLIWIEANLAPPGGGIVWRFGDPRYHVGTVEHLHINVFVTKPGVEYRPPLAKTEAEIVEDYQRLMAYRELVKGRGIEWLFSPEGIEYKDPK